MNNAVADAEELGKFRDISDEEQSCLTVYSFPFIALIILFRSIFAKASHNYSAPSLVLCTVKLQ